MPESKTSILCRDLYKRHRYALDLIYEHVIVETRGSIRRILEELIRASGFTLDVYDKNKYIRFIPTELDFEFLKKGSEWSDCGRMLLFELKCAPSAKLNLVIGPGPEKIRQALFSISKELDELTPPPRLTKKYPRIYQHPFLRENIFALTEDQLDTEIAEKWKGFLGILPGIVDALGRRLRDRREDFQLGI